MQHILYRQKEQFSDGVGYSWIDGLKAHAESNVSDQMLKNAKHVYPFNTPLTKEAYYYRMIFEKHFPQQSARMTVPGGPSVACSTAKAVEWDQAWAGNLDPSGRAALGCHDAAYKPTETTKSDTKSPSGAGANANPNGAAAPIPAAIANGAFPTPKYQAVH